MRKFVIPLLTLALVLVLGASVVLAGCGSAEEGSATGDGSTATYTDDDYGFSFDYPSDWQVVTATETNLSGGAAPTVEVTVGNPDGAVIDDTGVDIFMVRVYELNIVIDESVLPQTLTELQGLITGMQADDPSLQIIEPLSETTVGALSGYAFTATFQWADGTLMKTTSYFVFDGDIEYQLLVQSTEDNWESNQDVFAAFVSSFQPGGGAE